MKRVALICAVAVLGFSSNAFAQLVMQMGNGWSFTVGGNVNAFGVYTGGSIDQTGPITGGLVAEEQGTRIRTRPLPAFFTPEGKGGEARLPVSGLLRLAPPIHSNRPP